MPQRFNILTVDDEPSVAQSLSFALDGPARMLTAAFDGDEALARIDTHSPPFDLIITDNNMPRVSGLELVRLLRARNFGGKIVVLSAYLSEEIRCAYKELSVDTMLPKPFDLGELRKVINSLTDAA